jgi:hypothetical protein
MIFLIFSFRSFFFFCFLAKNSEREGFFVEALKVVGINNPNVSKVKSSFFIVVLMLEFSDV